MAAEDWIPDHWFDDLFGSDEEEVAGYYRAPLVCKKCGKSGGLYWKESVFAVDGRIKEGWTLREANGRKHVCGKRDLDREVTNMFDDLTVNDQ